MSCDPFMSCSNISHLSCIVHVKSHHRDNQTNDVSNKAKMEIELESSRELPKSDEHIRSGHCTVGATVSLTFDQTCRGEL